MLCLLASLVWPLSANPDCEVYDPNICQGHTGGVFISSPTSCAHWIQCNLDEIRNCGVCPNDFLFNPETASCAHKDTVECNLGALLCAGPEIKRVAHPDSCTIYFQCLGTGPAIEQSCAEGLHFDEANQRCDLIENVRCLREPIQIECPATDRPFTMEPHPFVCDLYFICINGVATELQCLPGMHFDVNLRECQVIEEAVCIIDETDPGVEIDPGNPVDPSDPGTPVDSTEIIAPIQVKLSPRLTPY